MEGLVPRPHRPRLDEPQRRFGTYVRERRQAKRMGLRACAEKIGLAPSHLSNIENFRVTAPAEPIIAKMAEVLDVPVSSLLARAGRLPPNDLKRFWESPLILSLIMATAGWNEQDARVFQEAVLAAMTE
jgi:transcriptional regulator with XRE-family HTH domain